MSTQARLRDRIVAQALLGLSVVSGCLASSNVTSPDVTCFDTKDLNERRDDVPVIRPWRVIELDPQYGGQWVVAGDLDKDTDVEIVSARNFNQNDVHYTTTAVAQDLDGSVCWTWGESGRGRKTWHHDVACQIHDWDGDGLDEILVAHSGGLYNHRGERIATFDTPDSQAVDGSPPYERSLLTGDMTGDGVPDVLLATPEIVYIYRNVRGKKASGSAPLGTEANFTLY